MRKPNLAAVILVIALPTLASCQDPAVIKPRTSFEYSRPLLCMAVSPDGKFVAHSDGTGTHVWDVAAGKRAATLRGKPSLAKPGFLSLAYRPDGKVLAAGAAHIEKLGEVQFFDVATGKFTALKYFGRAVVSLAYSSDGANLVTAAPGTNITVWDPKTDKAVASLPGIIGQGGSPDWITFGAKENTLVRAIGTRVEVWDLATRKRLKWFEPPQKEFNTSSNQITPDGKTCFQGGGIRLKGMVRVWDVDTGEERGTLEGHKGAVRSLAISPDGKLLASGATNSVRLWYVDTLKCLAVLEGHTGQIGELAFSRDGRVLVSSCAFDSSLKVWDVPAIKRNN